jgi:hypothetical protein
MPPTTPPTIAPVFELVCARWVSTGAVEAEGLAEGVIRMICVRTEPLSVTTSTEDCGSTCAGLGVVRRVEEGGSLYTYVSIVPFIGQSAQNSGKKYSNHLQNA